MGDDILTIGDKIQAFIDAFGDIASDVLDDLRDAYNDATETPQGLLGQQSPVAHKTSAASLVVTAKEEERDRESVVVGKRGLVRLDRGGSRRIKQKKRK